MQVPEIVGDPNSPTSILTATKDGYPIDLQNVPGMTKIRLIKEGQMDIDRFVMPPNMPGKKLVILRQAHREKMEAQIAEIDKKEADKNPYKVGDMISYKENTYEVLKVDGERVQISKDDKEVWVKHTKVEKG